MWNLKCVLLGEPGTAPAPRENRRPGSRFPPDPLPASPQKNLVAPAVPVIVECGYHGSRRGNDLARQNMALGTRNRGYAGSCFAPAQP